MTTTKSNYNDLMLYACCIFPTTSYFCTQVNFQRKTRTKAASSLAPKTTRLYTRTPVQAKFRNRPLRAGRSGLAPTQHRLHESSVVLFQIPLKARTFSFKRQFVPLTRGERICARFLTPSHGEDYGGPRVQCF